MRTGLRSSNLSAHVSYLLSFSASISKSKILQTKKTLVVCLGFFFSPKEQMLSSTYGRWALVSLAEF